QVERMLDEYTASWIQGRMDACEATHVRGEQSEKLLDLRMACFDRRLQELNALTDLLSKGPDEQILNRAAEASRQLTGFEGCADARSLAAVVPLPDNPKAKDEVQRLHKRLAEALSLKDVAKLESASRIIREVAMASKQLAYAPLEAEALTESADIDRFTGALG